MIIMTILVIFTMCGIISAEETELVKVYCFSADLEAGFKDSGGEAWCRELGKRGAKKKSLMLVDDRRNADVLTEFLGVEKIEAEGQTTYFYGGYAWKPSQTKHGARAVITIGDFKKGFFATGINWQGPGAIMRQAEGWIRENRTTILEKAKQKK